MSPNYYLVKSEPYVFSFADLIRDGRAVWDGVRNFEARNNLRAMQTGDLLLFYHSNEGKAVVGIATVVRTAYPDPTADPAGGGEGGDWSVVDVAPVCALRREVTLDQIRAQPRLRDINLLRRNRLSVVPITPDEFATILQMGDTPMPSGASAPARPDRRPAAAKPAPRPKASATAKPAPKSKAPAAAKPAPGPKAPTQKPSTRRGTRTAAPHALWALLTLGSLFSAAHRAHAEGPPPVADPASPGPTDVHGSPLDPRFDASVLLDTRLVDLQDRAQPLRGYYDKQPRGPVLVVLYQDRKSADENPTLKVDLGQLADAHPGAMHIVALADVGGYDFWPAKGYVKDALRPLQAEGAKVLCDWQGTIRKRFGLRPGQSTVFVLSPTGTLATVARGQLRPEQSQRLLRTIGDLLPTPRATPAAGAVP